MKRGWFIIFCWVISITLGSLKCRTTKIDPIDTVVVVKYDTVYVDRIDTVTLTVTTIDTVIVKDSVVLIEYIDRIDTVYKNIVEIEYIDRVDTFLINHYDTIVLVRDTIIFRDKIELRIDTIWYPQYDTIRLVDTVYTTLYDTIYLLPPKPREVDTTEVMGYDPMHQWNIRSNTWRTDSSVHYGTDTSTYMFYGHDFWLRLKSDRVSGWLKVIIDGEEWMDINMRSSEVYYHWFHGPELTSDNHRIDLVRYGDGGSVVVGIKYAFFVDPNLWGMKPSEVNQFADEEALYDFVMKNFEPKEGEEWGWKQYGVLGLILSILLYYFGMDLYLRNKK